MSEAAGKTGIPAASASRAIASASHTTSSQDPLPKQPSAISRLRRAITDLRVLLAAESPAVPAMVANLQVELEAAKKAHPSATDKDRQTLDELFKQGSLLVLQVGQTRAVGPPRETGLEDFTIDWDEVGRLDDVLPGLGSKFTLGPQLHRDVIESILRSPAYVTPVFKEKAVEIFEHWDEFCAVTEGLLISQFLVAVLAGAPDPTMTSKIIALVLEAIIIAFAVHAAVSAGKEASDLANAWWSKVSNAHGDSKVLDDAAYTFVKLAFAIINAITAALGAASATTSGINHAVEFFGPKPPGAPKPTPSGKSTSEKSAKTDNTEVGKKTQLGQKPDPNAEPTPKKSGGNSNSSSPQEGATKAPSQAKPRVNKPVPGVFGQVENPFTGVEMIDDPIRVSKDGTRVLKTHFFDLNGEPVGWIERAFNPRTKTFEMRNAFLDRLPETRAKPAAGPWMTPTGTPREAYMTLRQMKLLGMMYGELVKVKMSTIQNVRAIIELHVQLSKGLPLDEAVMNTHSIAYGETSIVQSGHKIVGAHVGGDIWTDPLDVMLKHYETGPDGKIVKSIEDKHTYLLREYGQGIVNRSTVVKWNYDIELTVAPFEEGSQ